MKLHPSKADFLKSLMATAGLALCLFLGLSTTAKAQQYPLFTNYLLNQYAFNPATTGLVQSTQVNLYYRKQWAEFPGAPTTRIAALRTRLRPIPFGLGGYFFNDEAGALRRSGGTGLISYTQQLGEKTAISVGFAGGYHQIRLMDGFNAVDDTDQLIQAARTGAWVPDFNAGLHVQSGNFYLGFSVPQIFEPRPRFESGDGLNRLESHYYLISGYDWGISEQFRLEPSVMIKMVSDNHIQAEGALRAFFLKSFWVGGLYRTEDAIAAMAGFSAGKLFEAAYAYDFTSSDLRLVSSGTHELSLVFRWGRYSDKDNDGISDQNDLCPDLPGTKDKQGCPDNPVSDFNSDDIDGDGIPNPLDFCPELAGHPDNHGCPSGDRDGDGIPDISDDCPGIVGVSSNNGCPINDRDADGIIDQFDQCPDVAGTFVNRGCPDTDTDKDGTPDASDKCPATFGPSTNNGCPVVTMEESQILEFAIRNLLFENGQVTIQETSKPYLIQLADLMKTRTDWRLRITGHADNKGADRTNLLLSKDRAEAVFNVLLSQGVRRQQLIIDYAGASKPSADNSSEAGRQLNRRVELEFVFD
jgi:type IX secretion system PorP/SprF family membrane protein